MNLPESRKRLLRNYAGTLFNTEGPQQPRQYTFYVLLRPVLDWAKTAFVEAGLEPDEAESELFLLTIRIFNKYDLTKSSIVPYVERAITWEVSSFIKKLSRKEVRDPFEHEISYQMPDEIYLSIPAFLLENKWLARDLSRAEKHLILRLLVNEHQGCRTLADDCRMGKTAMNTRLSNLVGKIRGRFS